MRSLSLTKSLKLGNTQRNKEDSKYNKNIYIEGESCYKFNDPLRVMIGGANLPYQTNKQNTQRGFWSKTPNSSLDKKSEN